jgi:aminoglycoside phosphotransferase family enzyme
MQKITGQGNDSPDITLEAKIEFLKRPESYPDRPHKVEAVETHMSWVFLTENYAYKLKKPVRYEFLDFSTIDARHHDCEEEIRLNRRLARDVYIGLLPLTADADGNMVLGGDKTAIDWLVKMRRLPTEKMLDNAIKTQSVNETEITRFALMLARFYKGSPSIEISPSEYKQRFEAEIQDNLRILTTPAYGLPIDLPPVVCAAQLEFLKRESELFGGRVNEGRIIEAHGDLRPEHICLETEPVIIDSLEFKREFRILDPADELSFLALECERLGAPPFVTNLIFETYSRITSDTPPEKLVYFYKSCRAGLRAKLAIWHLRDPKLQDISKWLILARKYLDLADAYIRKACAGFTL